MDNNKDFFSHAIGLVSIVDFIKWTATFGEGMIAQVQAPLSGVQLSPGLSHLFALGRDDIGWMLVMDEREGAWLEHFPFASILLGASDGLILVGETNTMLEQKIGGMGIEIFVPQVELRQQIANEQLMGFAIRRAKTGAVERVNRIVPVMTIKKYSDLARDNKSKTTTGLFAA